MTLSLSSVLTHWSSRYGILPIVGGKPVFSRNSAGTVGDVRGELYDAIINTPRSSWETDRATSANERRAMLLAEMGRTNNLPWSVDFSNAAWTKTNLSVTTGILDPKGGTSACTLTATAASASASQTLSAGSSLIRTNALWIRRRTGAGNVNLWSPDTATPRVISTLTNQWQRFTIPNGAAATARRMLLEVPTSGDAIDVYNGQQEDGPFATSDIVNVGASTTSRLADLMYWNYPFGPQAMMLYLRYVEGSVGSTVARLLNISDATSSGNYLALFTAGAASVQYFGGATVASSVAAIPAIGDTNELVVVLNPSAQVQLIQSINGAAVTNGSLSAGTGFPSAFSDTKLYLNSVGSADVGARRYADVRIVKYADVVASTPQGIMDELRAFELGPNGDIL